MNSIFKSFKAWRIDRLHKKLHRMIYDYNDIMRMSYYFGGPDSIVPPNMDKLFARIQKLDRKLNLYEEEDVRETTSRDE